MKQLNWAATQRQNFIGEKLRNVGTLNRFDLEEEFGVSPQQASFDIACFMDKNPATMKYDKSLKIYIYQGEKKKIKENEFEKIGNEINASLCANHLTSAVADFLTDLALRVRILESKESKGDKL